MVNRKQSKIIKIFSIYLLILVISLVSNLFLPRYSGLIVAASFLYAPVIIKGTSAFLPEVYGFTLKNIKKGLFLFFLSALLIFPVFSVGFWAYQRIGNKRTMHFNSSYLYNASQEFIGNTDVHKTGLLLWCKKRKPVCTLLNNSLKKVTLKINTKKINTNSNKKSIHINKITLKNNKFYINRKNLNLATITLSEKAKGVRILGKGDWNISFPGSIPHTVITPNNKLNSAIIPVSFSLWWWINFILWNFFMVALPEEFFFRGFLQTEFSSVVNNKLIAVILTSALFAIGHLTTNFNLARLAVFFPSLVFGWLREKEGSLISAILFHGTSNLLMEFLIRMI